MKMQNTLNSVKSKKSLLIGLSAFLVIGIGLLVSTVEIDNSRLLSQFSGANVTPANAASMWSASPSNPYLSSVGSYNTRLDMVIKSALARGSSLPAANFQIYLDNLAAGMVTISNRPEYSGDKDVKNMIGYISYEMTDAKASFSNGNGFISSYTNMVEDAFNRSGTTGVNTSTPVTNQNTTANVVLPVTTNINTNPRVSNPVVSVPVATTPAPVVNKLPTSNSYMIANGNTVSIKIGKDLGYNNCLAAFSEGATPFTISSNGSSISAGGALQASIKKNIDGSFETTSLTFGLNGFEDPNLYVNVYCTKTNSRIDEERIFPITQFKNLSSAVTTISLSKIPRDADTSSAVNTQSAPIATTPPPAATPATPSAQYSAADFVKTTAKIGDTVTLNYSFTPDRNCTLLDGRNGGNRAVIAKLDQKINGTYSFVVKAEQVSPTTGIAYYEMKCDNGTTRTRPVTIENYVKTKTVLNCTNTSVVAGWYKEVIGRCGEDEGIKYWSDEITSVGSKLAKERLENAVRVALNGKSKSEYNNSYLCEPGAVYVENTNFCKK